MQKQIKFAIAFFFASLIGLMLFSVLSDRIGPSNPLSEPTQIDQ